MKHIINRLSGIALFVFFPILFFTRKKTTGKIIIFFIAITILSGCFQHYFRTHTQTNTDAATIQKLMAINKYFIIHLKGRVGGLENLTVLNDKLEADIVPLQPEHLKYINPQIDKTNQVKLKDKTTTLTEVHLYTTTEINSGEKHISISLSSFNRMDIYEFDKGATTTNHILSLVGVTVVVTSVVGLIAFAIACNCPQVYIDNGKGYEFVSGVYSGAIYSSMERTDYLPLPMMKAGKTFKLKIANVKNEEQYINRMQLMQISHRSGINVLADRHGNVFTYNNPEAPVTAIINNTVDIKKQLAAKDNLSYTFDSNEGEKGFSNTILTFKKPINAKRAKLVVHGGNSLWSGYLYHSFAQMFGEKYDTWRMQKDKSDPKEMEQWQKDQSLPLMVYVEKNGHWELADYFAHTGNTATRDMIMELDVVNTGSDQVRIKLETVYQFWNIDFAGIDYSENENTNISYLDPSIAINSGNKDQKDALKRADAIYSQLSANEEISLEFMMPDAGDKNSNSYFLISTGYYHNVQKYGGAPDLKSLNQFKEKGSFDSYSRQKFTIIRESLTAATVNMPVLSDK